MEINLLSAIKLRLLDELRYTVQVHQVYRDKVRVYHKFPYKERPMMGVVFQNASSTRTKLSADDYAGALKSHLALARAKNRTDRFLLWAWEDPTNMTKRAVDEDLSSQITGSATYGTNRVFNTAHQIIAGKHNTVIADNFRQVDILKNGEVTHAEFLDGKEKLIMLPEPPVVGDTLTVSYWYSNLTPPGRYYIELISSMHFVIDPLYDVEDENVIPRTLGTELTASLDNSNIYPNLDVLYTKKNVHSNKFFLEKGTDYTLASSGLITFLNPLQADTTLFATYRWIGDRLGPFEIPNEFHYSNEALPGVTLAFSNELEAGGRLVLIVNPKREPTASVFSGHFNMNFDITAFTRDPKQLADLTDHILNHMWNNRRLPLIAEGITIEEMDPGGETEDVYDANTGDLYYKNSISMQVLTEWKKFVPFLWEIKDFDMHIFTGIKTSDYFVSSQNQVFEMKLVPYQEPFEVKYPKVGYAKVF